MDYQQFKDEIKKVNGTRVHKVTGSIGVYDAYKFIRKNKWFDIGKALTEKQFYRIIRKINQHLAEEICSGHQINLPHRMGTLEIRKRPARLSIQDGKLVTNLPIDWDATLKLWYQDEESFKNKTLVRVENEEIFKVYYNKYSAVYNNKSFYSFRPNRELQRNIKKCAEEGTLDAFLFQRYE